ncbi:MAG: aminotransferase class I/II-fold pyridoxal phosphate-dependent enzyme [Oligoflexia bacterium]|nr:aminotransferase class I/II-fold pyridoxal phosphate-dependent enzyme [Oligoflexia bacterium]
MEENIIIHNLIRNAEKLKEKTAIKFVNDSNGNFENLIYSDLAITAKSIAVGLKKIAKTKEGNRILIMLPPGKEYVCSVWGGFLSGVVVIPSLPPDPAKLKQTVKQFKSILADSQTNVVLTNQMIKKKLFLISLTLPWVKFVAIEDLLLKIDLNKDPFVFPKITNNSLALLQYTSGSTSNPKGVMTSYKNIIETAELITKKLASVGNEIHVREMSTVSWLPPFHTTGLFTGAILPIYHGATSTMISPLAFLANPLLWPEEISKSSGKIIIAGGPNFAYDICANKVTDKTVSFSSSSNYSNSSSYSKYDLSRWKVAFLGTEPVNPLTIKNFCKVFSSYGFKEEYMQPSYGLTEQVCILSGIEMDKKPLIISLDRSAMEKGKVQLSNLSNLENNNLENNNKDHSKEKIVVGCGCPLEKHSVKIINPETLVECDDKSIGEIWISGPTVTAGYWRKHELNAKVFGAKIEGDEKTYLRTGDLGFFHKKELFIVGRHKELIILRGKNYYPNDIEKVVEQECSAIVRGTTVAFSAEVTNEEVLCIVAESLDKSEKIVSKIKQLINLNNSILPYHVFLVDEGTLPRSSMKKIQRFQVVELFSPKIVANKNIITEEISEQNESIQENSVPATQTTQITQTTQMSNIESFIVEKISQATKSEITDINLDGPLTNTGLDSLQLVELTLKISSWRKVKLPDDFAWKFATIREAAKFVSEQEVDENVWTDLSEEGDTLANFERWVASQIPQIVNVVDYQKGRELIIQDKKVIDFASCNYLGFDFHPDIIASIAPAIEKWGVHPSWTRIVASPKIYIELEEHLKELMGAKHIIAFATATLTHVGVLPVLCADGGTIFIDSAAHTSIQEGAHLARAKGATVVTFKHRNLADLERLLEENPKSRRKVIAIDGVYSMSGWWVNLPEYVALAKKHNAYIYLDDAHGFGIIGENPSKENPFGFRGNGIVKHYNLDYSEDRIIYVSVLSKAYSSIGAFITACDEEMMKLIYTAPTIVFTGPIPTASLASAIAGIQVNNREGEKLREVLWERTQQLVQGARKIGFEVDNSTGFPIVFVVIGGIDNVIKGCQILWKHGILITPGIFPAMPLDRGGLRFSVTTVNSKEHVEAALIGLHEVYEAITGKGE